MVSLRPGVGAAQLLGISWAGTGPLSSRVSYLVWPAFASRRDLQAFTVLSDCFPMAAISFSAGVAAFAFIM